MAALDAHDLGAPQVHCRATDRTQHGADNATGRERHGFKSKDTPILDGRRKPRYAAAMPDVYRGSLKHKSRPSRGRKGTICPEWTHDGSSGSLGNDPYAFEWQGTPAVELLNGALIDPESQRRFATRNGIAFEAKPTADGTWHGFPVPWEDVPAVTGRDIKRYFSRPASDIRWALDTDDD